VLDNKHPLALPAPVIASDSAPCADWKDRADARIENIRKRDAEITVTGPNGDPLPGVSIVLEQTRQDFPFGAGMSKLLLGNTRYQEFFRSHFNWAVFDNESKWYANEPEQGCVTYTHADALNAWCLRHAIKVRGHCLFWEPAKWQPAWVRKLGTAELRTAAEERLRSAVTHFRGKFLHWDVNNEILHGSFFRDRLGEAIWPWMFARTHELDPDARLFINEFNILSVDQDYQEVETDAYVAQVRKLLDRGAPITDVGIQGHVWAEDILKTPGVIEERLDRVATLGLPVWITEFDVADEDENARADKLELIYRTAYSHPAVAGIFMWSVWAGDSWRGPNASIVNLDWSLNAAGRRYERLMCEWSTRVSGATGADGRFRFRGFYGRYNAILSVPGHTPRVCSFALPQGAGRANVTLALQDSFS
jgi:endo-1,4-beta-xylanase